MASRFKAPSIAIGAIEMAWNAIAVFLAGCALVWPAHADEALWSLLKGGGQVVLMRHTATTPGAGDPEGMVLNDCGTQRNLTDEGRAHARRVGARQIEQLRELISRRPVSGNVMLVTHGSTIQAVSGISPGTGEMVVIEPQGGGRFTVAGRLEAAPR